MRIITVDDLADGFLTRCPGLNSAWDSHLEFWGGEERGTFIDMSVIAHYLVQCYEQQKLGEFPDAFAFLEQCLADGDDHAKEAVTIGIMEDIQNISSHREFGSQVFESWLGPESKVEWHRLAAAWRDLNGLADMVRKETGKSPQDTSMPNLDGIEDPQLRRMIEQQYRQ